MGGGYIRTLLLFDTMDMVKLQASFHIMTDVFKSISFKLNLDEITPSNHDVIIAVVQKSLFVIDTHHSVIDGTLLTTIMDVWGKSYGCQSVQAPFHVEYTGNYPIHKRQILQLKEKYPFSDYVIATTLWSSYLYQMTKKRTFGHIISTRPLEHQYTPGNFITCVQVSYNPSFYDSCVHLTDLIHSVKHQRKTKCALLRCLVAHYISCDFIFDSWLSFKHVKFTTPCKGIYLTHWEDHPITYTHYLSMVGIHEEYYYLTHSMKECDSTTFHDFIKYSTIL